MTKTDKSDLRVRLADAAGAVTDFNNTRSYTWSIAHATGGTSGFTPGAVTNNTAGFTNSLGAGEFIVTTYATDVLLSFAVPPAITAINVNNTGDTASISGTNGPPKVTYQVLSSTKMLIAVTNWAQVGSGTFRNDGSFTFNGSISPADAQRFYIIVTP